MVTLRNVRFDASCRTSPHTIQTNRALPPSCYLCLASPLQSCSLVHLSSFLSLPSLPLCRIFGPKPAGLPILSKSIHAAARNLETTPQSARSDSPDRTTLFLHRRRLPVLRPATAAYTPTLTLAASACQPSDSVHSLRPVSDWSKILLGEPLYSKPGRGQPSPLAHLIAFFLFLVPPRLANPGSWKPAQDSNSLSSPRP
ncbi:uncharacterized protein K452DRAFT_103078 [Aplosporella prunicola CBS 121167]|uniref:Uncharacterized protein n=1 Tax=Aplosporella prunicola CBS 121167 TaxID=1176127 RepID=A0A6A6BSV0_9PEZI|nr:uncharacterized protein K452DRAFT_103078 [Aplosporella prunicola CBS 121167]KAF2145907.1 hypothetical protein K452DRAFT_103078 [Aplosporella prunicola CBS 121167]